MTHFRNGDDVLQDYKTAAKWLTLAAEQGLAGAQSNLGFLYDSGHGVLEDDQTAVKWFALAAEQGDADAQANLGTMYATGEGVLRDNIYAHMWFDIAASLGNENASENREIIAKRMTPADISKARQLARECVAKDYKGC